jgi:hypothetical protein
MPFRASTRKRSRCANHRGHMHIMAAGMHDADGLTGRIPGGHVTGVAQAGFFDDRQRIQVRTNE